MSNNPIQVTFDGVSLITVSSEYNIVNDSFDIESQILDTCGTVLMLYFSDKGSGTVVANIPLSSLTLQLMLLSYSRSIGFNLSNRGKWTKEQFL